MAFHIQLPGKIYMMLVILECLAMVTAIVTAIVFAGDVANSTVQVEVIQLCVLALVVTIAFCYFSIDAVIKENLFQFLASYVAHFCLFLFTLWNWSTPGDPSESLNKITGMAFWAVTALQIIYLLLAYFVYDSFGWYVYKVVGANADMQSMYTATQIFSTLLKLDAVCTTELLLMAAFFIYGATASMTTDIILASVAYVFQTAWALWVFRGVRKEDGRLVKYILYVAWILPAYVLYKMVQEGIDRQGLSNFDSITWGLFFAAFVSFMFRGLLVYWAYRCRKNFGRGLKERVFDYESKANGDG